MEEVSELRRFVQNAPAALAMFDREMRYIAASGRWIADYRIPRADFLGESHYDLFPEMPERWREVHNRALAGEVLSATADPFLRLDGSLQLISWEVRPWHDTDGSIGGIVIAAEDITATAHAREHERTPANIDELRQTRVYLAASEAKFALVFERAPFAVCLTEMPSGRITDVNPAFLSMFEWDKAAVTNKTSHELGMHVAPENRTLLRDMFAREGGPHAVEVELRTRTGKVRSVRTTVDAVALDGTSYALITLDDITERRIAEREMARARLEAEAANRAKDEFLAMLGHELRNPLAPIQTALDLMRMRGGSSERERDVIERQLRHVVHLVDDLLDVSRITRGMVELARERLDLSMVTARAIEIASPLLEQHHHKLERRVPHLFVVGDPARLAQVISNLLTNAAKYTPPGGRIAIGAEQVDGEVKLWVEDNGAGIPPDLLPRLFHLFVQGHQGIDRKQGGLGLGLAIVHKLVELHGGTVAAHSEGVDNGSTFSITLPAAPTASDIPTRPSASIKAAIEERRRVLVVDDNSDLADMISAALEKLGYETRIANDGPSALQAAGEFHPDVALLDIGLPVMDGYELARRLRESPDGSHLRMIAVTGYGQDKDRRRAREAGFDEHLIKPVEMKKLVSLLERSS